jgi:hypothetical protein
MGLPRWSNSHSNDRGIEGRHWCDTSNGSQSNGLATQMAEGKRARTLMWSTHSTTVQDDDAKTSTTTKKEWQDMQAYPSEL